VSKLGTKSKLAIAGIIAILLIVIGRLFFPVPQPGLELAANYSEPFYKLGPIYITNTLITSWISILVLIGFFYFATRKMKLVPKGLQNFAETIIELLLDFVEGVAGKENGRRFLPIVATIFLYVLFNAWLALLPLFNFIGISQQQANGTTTYVAILRAANTDMNVTLMLALVSFFSVEYWGITSLGLRHYLGKFFRFEQLFQALGQLIRGKVKSAVSVFLYGAIDIFVGVLELLSEFVRIISFTFRLFGNMTAGEILLLMMAFLIPWIIPAIFYGLETFLGFVQAFIFAGLTLVFATMAVAAHESEHQKS
jgi:F-type H+-transporting ATPase subunit a